MVQLIKRLKTQKTIVVSSEMFNMALNFQYGWKKCMFYCAVSVIFDWPWSQFWSKELTFDKPRHFCYWYQFLFQNVHNRMEQRCIYTANILLKNIIQQIILSVNFAINGHLHTQWTHLHRQTKYSIFYILSKCERQLYWLGSLRYFTLLQGLAVFNTLLSHNQITVNGIIYLVCMKVSYTWSISYQKSIKKINL